MNSRILTLGLSTLTLGAVSLTAVSAQAATLSPSDCLGAEYDCTYSNPFFSLEASDGSGAAQLTRKSFSGYEGIGVATAGTTDIQDDPSWGEIDFDESLNVNLGRGTILESLDLGFLYRPGVNFDRVFETAKITAKLNDGSILENIFSVTGSNTGSLSGLGSVSNISPSNPGGAGLYSLLNPFGNAVIKSFSVTAVDSGKNFSRQSWDSDFVVAQAQVADVPEPSIVLGLLGVGILGLRRRRAQ
ncbi:MAG: PEP-CTERM sorting domain-containing protein [Jaaginema sp. PMC 1079.18]|nr:PEP-CTERM sorting domain-containing protein [Jaaginema sp. PMC 1080.18]MEC4852908.1 PEP-CTERM sorting domain-containing protein [Jaaginema sp. PMC 1079.18]MEC4868857.1 PEP-CTERM sorting domain-containing protein [Jaaginema sp. PMC 1078.18]